MWEIIDAARTAWVDDMAAFLCFTGVRLTEMRRVLKPTESLYLHCDPTASHYLKILLDAIFGGQFRNELIWHYRTSSGRPTQHFIRNHDTILFYGKSLQNTFNIQREAWPESTLRKW